jgi:hypothetical protein
VQQPTAERPTDQQLMVVIAGERAKNIKTGGLKKCKNFTAQHAVRKVQTTRQQSAILKLNGRH